MVPARHVTAVSLVSRLAGSACWRSAAFSGFAAALGLSLLLPLMNYVREPPIGDFFGEWASALMFSLAALFLLPTLPRRQSLSVGLLLPPAVMAAILIVHVSIGSFAYAYDWIIWLAYLFAFVLAVLVGQSLRASSQWDEAIGRLAWTFIFVATANAAIQLLQVTGKDLDFFPYVLPLVERSACRIYGNVGQANQAAMLAWLAMAAVLYLVGIRKLARPVAVVLIVVLLMSSALTASRMAWLFFGVVAVLALVLRAWPAEGRAPRAYLVAMLFMGLLLSDQAAQGLLAAARTECASGLQRMAETGEAGFLIRAELWRLALQIWGTSPWIGTGAGSFLGKIYELGALDRQQPLDNYPHNSALHILAEFGLIGAGVIAALTISWLWTLVRRRSELGSGDAVVLAWLGVIGAYSMLEFPLWYMHYLLLFGLLLGIVVRCDWSVPKGAVPVRSAIAAMAVLCLAGCGAAFRDYLALQRLHGVITMKIDMRIASTPEIIAAIRKVADGVVFYRLYVEHFYSLVVPLNNEDLEQKIVNSERLLRRLPQSTTIAQRAALAVLAGNLQTARDHVRRLHVFWAAVAGDIDAEVKAIVARGPAELEPLGKIFDEEKARAPLRRW